jgi:D-beta-D-heptose 7-phosphate kinase/D-beta-D-heptose 1-phosphate adenosyltransferase
MSHEGKIIVVSGGFDPVHIGHVRMFEEAKALVGEAGTLIVVLNNDNWLRDKKGRGFMSESDRKELIESLRAVDEVFITDHAPGEYFVDKSVVRALREIKPHIFANGGDRVADNIPEYQLCNELSIEMVFNIGHGGKVRSSSELLRNYMQPQ